MSQTLRFRTELQRKHPDLPVFIRIPGATVAPWTLTEWRTVEGSLNGHDFGRRAIKDWTPGPDWFVEFLKPFLEATNLRPGDTVDVELHLADMTMPDEMAERMKTDPDFARAYEALIPNHKRKVVEHYLEAKTPAGPDRAAREDLALDQGAALIPSPVDGRRIRRLRSAKRALVGVG